MKFNFEHISDNFVSFVELFSHIKRVDSLGNNQNLMKTTRPLIRQVTEHLISEMFRFRNAPNSNEEKQSRACSCGKQFSNISFYLTSFLFCFRK